MHLLVTRPEPDAWQSKLAYEEIGITVTIAPLLEIAIDEIPHDAFDGASGVIATSKNGLRSLSLSGLAGKVKPLQVYCVGEATAAYAEDLKLRNITAGKGAAADLLPVIAERHASRAGPLIHLAGDHLAFDMAGALAKHGIKAVTLQTYRSVAAERLPPAALGGIKSGKINGVALMSPRTAETWAKLVEAHGLRQNAANVVHLCLSEAVAARLPADLQTRVEIALQPNEQEMLDLARKLASEFSSL